MLRPSPNHETQRLPNDDDEEWTGKKLVRPLTYTYTGPSQNPLGVSRAPSRGSLGLHNQILHIMLKLLLCNTKRIKCSILSTSHQKQYNNLMLILQIALFRVKL